MFFGQKKEKKKSKKRFKINQYTRGRKVERREAMTV